MPLTDLLESLGRETRPVKILRYRKKYTDYRTETESTDESPKSFEDWLNDQGIDPKKLLLNG